MGDFQGHPFRGNQWTDGNRVSEGAGNSATRAAGDWRDGSAPTPDDDPSGQFDARARRNLADTERQFGAQEYESASVVDQNGRAILFKSQGAESSAKFEDEELPKLEGGILSHNHPFSGPFSSDDLALTFKTRLREMRAICKNGTLYRLGFTKPLGTPGPVLSDPVRTRLLGILNSIYSESTVKTLGRIVRGEITKEQAQDNWANEMHAILLRWAATPEAKAAGMYYKRTRRS